MVNDAVQRQDGLAGGLAVLDGGLCGRRAGMKRRRVRQGLKGEGYQADSQATRHQFDHHPAAAAVPSAATGAGTAAHLKVQVHNVVAVVSDVWLVTLHAQLGLAASHLGQLGQTVQREGWRHMHRAVEGERWVGSKQVQQARLTALQR
jgi:1-deoxy-D-xylulose-5-phosphate synthase